MSMNNLLPELQPYKDKIPEFILKLYHILQKKQHADYLTWYNDQEILIKNTKKFQQKVLPQYFRHKHLASFIRQLNMYKFSKVSKIIKQKNHMYFRNQNFQRGKIQNLLKMKRNVKKKGGATQQTILTQKMQEYEDSDNISLNDKLIENDKNQKKLQQYKTYVKQSASRIKQLISKFSSNPIFETQLKPIIYICDELIQAKKQQIPSFGLSSSNHSYQQLNLLNISQKNISRLQGEFIFPSQCSLSNFNSFQNS